jgi:hypothetical protein
MIQLRTILAVFFTPKKAFQALLDRPRALAAVLLLIAVAIAAHSTTMSRIDLDAQIRLTAEEMASEPGKKVSETEIKKEAVRGLNVMRIKGYALILIIYPIWLLVPAIVFWLLCRWSPGRVRFKTSYSIAAHMWLPFGLRGLLSIPVILTYPSLDPSQIGNLFKTNLGSVVPFPGATLIDPFWIWIAVLMALAGRAAGWKTWKVVTVGLVTWLHLGLPIQMLI